MNVPPPQCSMFHPSNGCHQHLDLLLLSYSNPRSVAMTPTSRSPLSVLEEMRKIDECDVKEFDTLDRGEKTIVILGDRW